MTKNSILYRQIQGAIKSTIIAHGSISKKRISSATKRIIGNLNKLDNISYPDEPLKEALLIYLNKEHYSLELLRKKLDNPNINGDKKSHIAGKISEIRTKLIELNNLIRKNDLKNKAPVC